MVDPQKSVFISYRRSASSFIARAIFMDLKAHDYDVFMDVESIDGGSFDTFITDQIAARAHFILVLAPGTLERCSEKGDWLRREIEFAIDNRRNIVPVLVNHFDMNLFKEHLTGKLTSLARHNGLPLYHEYFDAGMDRLRERFLSRLVSSPIQPPPLSQASQINRRIKRISGAPKPTNKEISAEAYMSRGADKLDHGLYQAALADLNKAIKLNPNYATAFYYRGRVYYRTNNLPKALENLSRAIQLRGSDKDLHRIARGEILFVLGSYNDALADFAAAYRQRPDSEYAVAGLAITLRVLGQNKAAATHWQSLLRRNANYRDLKWVERTLNWRAELVEIARILISEL